MTDNVTETLSNRSLKRSGLMGKSSWKRYTATTGEWNTVTGEVSAGRNSLIWKDVDNNVIPWPPQTGEIYEIRKSSMQPSHLSTP